ncbi:MAG: ATP-binding protein [Bacteroidales bacterium]|nr:ATP-binding protein [Bacteroidales bacterium]
MRFSRDFYLQQLKNRMHNGMIKVVTGIRRSGKSYLLFHIFADFLRGEGVDEAHIIQIDLEDRRNRKLRDPDELLTYIDSQLKDDAMHYVLIDEIQMVSEFEDVLNSYLKVRNADVYVIGSNSHLLSTDVITEFRGRGDEVRVHPLTFAEMQPYFVGKTENEALREYMLYGGLPHLAELPTNEQKELYLKNLMRETYLRDIKERYKVMNDDDLVELVDMLSSSIGGLVSPKKLEDTFRTVKKSTLSAETIKRYIDLLQDAFVLEKAVRYDIKGRKYIDTPAKYYFEDLGLRNARINFRQNEQTHLMENLIYNELRFRGYSVDVGQVVLNAKDAEGKSYRKVLEVDFVCNKGYERYYIQSAFALPDEEKMNQEQQSLLHIKDGFQKVIIVAGLTPSHRNEVGVLFLNLWDFLTHKMDFAIHN